MPGRASLLYTPEILALAVDLAAFPLHPDMQRQSVARSRTCGSSLQLGLNLSNDGVIHAIGIQATSCAIGQASASIFARSATGVSPGTIDDVRTAMLGWLSGIGPQPDWTGLEQLQSAVLHPGRHGAIMLAWDAAYAALFMNGPAR